MKSKTLESAVIDRGRVFDGILFATHRDRNLYIGTVTRDRPQWLKDNPGRWQLLADVQQEAAAPWPRARSENNTKAMSAEPRSPEPGHAQNDDDNDSVALPERSSPPCQPTLLPAPMNENVPSTSTQTELPPRAEAATSEIKQAKTETSPLVEATGHKRRRSGGHRFKKQKPPAENSKSSRKLSPERMRIVLDSLSECPILAHAAHNAGIHRRTLEYWIKRSKAGDDGYDVEWHGFTFRFHEHCQAAIDDAHDDLLAVVLQMAMGGVTYKTDPFLVELGYQCADAYAKDENGDSIVETISPKNPSMIRLFLELARPEKWGKNRKDDDLPQKCGVLVVGNKTVKKSENNTAASIKVRQWKACRRKIRDAKA